MKLNATCIVEDFDLWYALYSVTGGVKMYFEKDKFFSHGKGCQQRFERSENLMRECALGKLPVPKVEFGKWKVKVPALLYM